MSAPALAFLLSVDDAGRFLALGGDALVLGHLRGGRADLPFLADVEDEHALLERRDSFHGGTVWRLTPLGDAPVSVGDEVVGAAVELRSGDRLRLGNLRIEFRVPDEASRTALLELRDGVECFGAQRVLLLASGEEGRVRIGGAKHGHVKVPRSRRDVVLVAGPERIVVRDADGEVLLEATLPLDAHRHVALGPAEEGRPPLTLGIGPVEPLVRDARGPEGGGTAR